MFTAPERPHTLSIVLVVLLHATPLPANIFGTGQNAFEMEFVAITGGTVTDDPLPQNPVRYGTVAYDRVQGLHPLIPALAKD